MHFLVVPVKILAGKKQSEQFMFMKQLDDHFVVCNKVKTITESLKWACNIIPPVEPFMFTVHLWN